MNQIDYTIDNALVILHTSNNQANFYLEFCDDVDEAQRIAEIMEEHNLIRLNKMLCTLTTFGIEVCNNGGWLVHLNQSKIKEQERLDFEKIELEKLKYDAKLAKWQIRVFWPVFIFGLIGGVSGIISLLLQLRGMF